MSATTRRPRPGEHDGVDYHFLTDDEFEDARRPRRLRRARPLLRPPLRDAARRARAATAPASRPVLLEIEVQGARQVREAMPEAVAGVHRAARARRRCATRLVGRGTDSPEQVARRLETAREELAAQHEFGHVVVNDRLEDAVAELEALVRGRSS